MEKKEFNPKDFEKDASEQTLILRTISWNVKKLSESMDRIAETLDAIYERGVYKQ